MILMQNGSVWASGYNAYGQLGDGSGVNRNVFVQVISGGVKAVDTGAYHSMVIKEDSSIWAVGSNEYGQFGDGSTKSEKSYTMIKLLDKSV